MPATAAEKSRAYTLRDIQRKGRALSTAERRWLEDYDKRHPPRRRVPLEPTPPAAPTLTPETIPSSPSLSAPPEPTPELDAQATKSDEPAPGFVVDAASSPAPPLDVTPPVGPAVPLPDHPLAVMLAGMVGGEARAWAAQNEWKPEQVESGVDYYRQIANVACHHYVPNAIPGPPLAAVITVGGAVAAIAGPRLRKELADKKATGQVGDVKRSPPPAPPSSPPPHPAPRTTPSATEGLPVASGY